MLYNKRFLFGVIVVVFMVVSVKSVSANEKCSWEEVFQKDLKKTAFLKEKIYWSNSLRSKNFFYKQHSYQPDAIRIAFPNDFPVTLTRTESLIHDTLAQDGCKLITQSRVVMQRIIYVNSYVSFVEEYLRKHQEYFRSDHETDDHYEHTVYVMTLGFLPKKSRIVLQNWFLSILHDPVKMKRYFLGFISLAKLLPFQREYLQGELRAFWRASLFDFSSFEKQLSSGKIHITSQKKKREAFLVRRWSTQKKKHPGTESNLIQMYQIWMLKFASELEMPEVQKWAKSLRVSDENFSLIQDLDLGRLFPKKLP